MGCGGVEQGGGSDPDGLCKVAEERRNILRMMFSDERMLAAQDDWRNVARYIVGAFRADARRSGCGNPAVGRGTFRQQRGFKAMWDDNEITGTREGLKRVHHPVLGAIELEFSTFAVEGRSDLNMMVYSPASPEVIEQFRSLIAVAC